MMWRSRHAWRSRQPISRQQKCSRHYELGNKRGRRAARPGHCILTTPPSSLVMSNHQHLDTTAHQFIVHRIQIYNRAVHRILQIHNAVTAGLPRLSQVAPVSSRRGTSFPTQRNTLLSWMKPLTGVDSNPTSPTSRPSPSIAISTPTPSDLHQPAGSVEAPPPVPSREPPLGQSPQPAVQQAPRSAQSAHIANPSPGKLESTSSKLAK